MYLMISIFYLLWCIVILFLDFRNRIPNLCYNAIEYHKSCLAKQMVKSVIPGFHSYRLLGFLQLSSHRKTQTFMNIRSGISVVLNTVYLITTLGILFNTLHKPKIYSVSVLSPAILSQYSVSVIFAYSYLLQLKAISN